MTIDTDGAISHTATLAPATTGTTTGTGVLHTVNNTVVTTAGTNTTYGQQISVTRTGAAGGTINSYGLDIQAVGDAGGTSTLTGLNVNVSGADTNYAAIFQGGNVGIGTATPTSLLHVKMDANSTSSATIENTNTGTAASSAFVIQGDTTFADFRHLNSGFTTSGLFTANRTVLRTGAVNGLLIGAASSAAPIIFATGGVDTVNERMRIDSSGNVGIGDISPDAKLDVEPTGAVTTTSYAQQINNLQTNTTTDAIDKYGLYISSTGSFTGSAGTATNNYGLYVATPTG
ncbi:MAG: hypothetical protein WD972_00260, partial [Candidatus Andersenbacteria bacterium]